MRQVDIFSVESPFMLVAFFKTGLISSTALARLGGIRSGAVLLAMVRYGWDGEVHSQRCASPRQ